MFKTFKIYLTVLLVLMFSGCSINIQIIDTSVNGICNEPLSIDNEKYKPSEIKKISINNSIKDVGIIDTNK
jgi:hypothetical protein